MTVQLGALGRPRRSTKRPLLDVVAEVLVAQPGASLADVALAAGISRTTLHKQYATRDELVRAVGFRAIEIWESAVDAVAGEPGTEAGLRKLLGAMIESGPQLTFLWRNPSLDQDEELTRRFVEVERHCLAVLNRAKAEGVLSPTVPDWWLLETVFAIVYTAAESVHNGYLAPREAPGLALNTLLHGLSADTEGTRGRRNE
jgi:AcrR family transcriptional regulator